MSAVVGRKVNWEHFSCQATAEGDIWGRYGEGGVHGIVSNRHSRHGFGGELGDGGKL